MKIRYSYFSGYIILLLLMVMIESCSGCSHHRRRSRERHRERVERRESNEYSRDRSRSSRSRSLSNKTSSRNYSEDQIASIAEGEDYDAMLDCQFAKLNELKRLKDEYFRGDMSDKKAEESMKEIEEKFSPVDKALEEAQREGLLTYNQHKRQLKLAGDYIRLVNSIFKRLGYDMSAAIDM